MNDENTILPAQILPRADSAVKMQPASNRLHEEQRNAIDRLIIADFAASDGKISSLSGPAGSGKTTTLAAMVHYLNANCRSVTVTTPTRQAARVLDSKGVEAATYHSAFLSPRTEVKPGPNGTLIKVLSFVPRPGVESDIIIVDEASMVPYEHINHLRSMCRHLILVGDGNQLPPVKDNLHPRGFFNALAHTAELETIHRQAANSPILLAAREVSAGKFSSLDNFEPHISCPGRKFDQLISDLTKSDESWCVVAWTNRMVDRVNGKVRHIRGTSSKAIPQEGEFMICRTNFGKWANGTTINIVGVDFVEGSIRALIAELEGDPKIVGSNGWSSKAIRVVAPPFIAVDELSGETMKGNFDLQRYLKHYYPAAPEIQMLDKLRLSVPRNNWSDKLMFSDPLHLEFAYARTVHKAQGSEFDTVVVIDQRRELWGATSAENYKRRADPTGMELISPDEAERRWTYTAMTRAKKHLILWPRKLDGVRVEI